MQEEDYLAFAEELARAAGGAILPRFAAGRPRVELKPDQTPVTGADREAEEVMRRLIHKHCPGHGIIGEEFGNENEDAEHVWVLDPIDGTKAFAAGCPLFGTLIALLKGGQPVLGVIHNPITRQLLIGDSRRTLLNNRPVKVSETRELSEAVLLTTSVSAPRRHQNAAAWDRLAEQVKMLRTWGDCYGYALVAQGGADIMADPVLAPWDLLALIPVIRGAGGVITDWQGNDPVKGNSILAANPRLHPRLVSILNPS